MPKTHEIFFKLKGFKYATPLCLNTGYYYIQFNKNSINLSVNVLLLVKYHYKHLPMEDINLSDISEHKINYFFQGFVFIREYIPHRKTGTHFK